MTPYEALRQCVEAMKLVDFKDCAESEELWHKLNAAQQVAEEVLKRPEQEPVAWLVYAEDHNGMNPQFPAYEAKLQAVRYASMFGQTPTDVRPLYAAPLTAAPVTAAAMSQVFKGADGLKKLAEHNAFWEQQPYGTRLYFGDGITEYLHRDVLRAAVRDMEGAAPVVAPVAAQQAAPGSPKPPSTPSEVIDFIASHFDSLDVEGPLEDRQVRMSVHDLLSAFSDWFDLDEVGGRQAVVAVPRITQAEIDYIGEQWDGCEYDAPGMTIDIGQAIRAELARLNATPQPAAAPSGDVKRDNALRVARAALKTADNSIKGREHTGFIHNAISVIDAATKE
jgi:hypothetical protein